MYPNQNQPGQQPGQPQPPSGYSNQPPYPTQQPGPGQSIQPMQQPFQTDQTPQPAAQPQLQQYGPQPSPTYAVDYLDQIAPPPPRAAFLSGFFGKAVIALGVIFVLAVSLIVAFGNTKKTADLEQAAVQLEHMKSITYNNQKVLKDGKLLALNSQYQIWIAGSASGAKTLLAQAGVQKKEYDKKMVAQEQTTATELSDKFLDAKLNADLDRIYAKEMTYRTQLLIAHYKKMSKASQAKAIRDYAKTAATNLEPIQKSFADFKPSK